MSQRLRQLLRTVALLAAGSLSAGDWEFPVDMVTGADAEIRLTVPGGQMPQQGFLPLRVRINNRATSERSWRLEIGSPAMGGYGGTGAELNSAHNFAVPGASTREFFIFAPVPSLLSRRGGGLSGTMTGPQVERTTFGFHLGYGWGAPNSRLAIEPALESRLAKLMAAETTPPPAVLSTVAGGRVPPRRFAGNPMQNISLIDPALWPADWRLWSSYATVMLDQATWDRLDSTRRRALLDWVALGGTLVRVNGGESRERFGTGLIVTRSAPMLTDRGDIQQFLLSDNSQQHGGPASLASAAFWDLVPRTWQLEGKHRWLTGYIVLFGLLIGPVNLFYFAPAGRRHRLFFTVPFISVGAAVVLFGIITLSDGLGGAGTRRAVVLLEPAQNQAVVFQRQISRTGMLAGRKFPLPADAIMTLDADDRQAMGAGQEMWREGDTASGDWFASRSVRQHTLLRLVPTRERVELVSPAGAAPVVQSTVGGTLRNFYFLDDKGAKWTAAEIPPGTRVTLSPLPGNLTIPQPDILRYVASHNRGTFYALGDAGGLIPTLPTIRWRDDLVLYTGRLDAGKEATP